MKDATAIYAAEVGATKLAEVRTPYLPENFWDFAPKRGEQAGEQSATVGFHNFNLRTFNLRISNPNK